MQKSSVLIVGAGALGLTLGYHFTLGGTAVTFLVRPSKLDAMKPPQLLYCYDDHQLKEYSDYQTITAAADAAKQQYDFVIVSLDGFLCRSAEGTQLLKELGDSIRSTSAKLIIGGVGIGLRDHYIQTTRLPEDRLMEGTLGNLAYQVQRANMPIHAPTDATVYKKAAIAYHHFPNKSGYMLASRPKQVAKEFAALYNRCGNSKVTLVPYGIYKIVNNAFFPITAVCDLAGWPSAAAMSSNTSLMSLCSRAMKDIIGMPQHGFIGKIVSWFVSEKSLSKLLNKMERESLPLDFHGFNKFHHGGKVRAQDIQVMQNCYTEGTAQGHAMPALKELLQKYEAHCKLQSTV